MQRFTILSILLSSILAFVTPMTAAASTGEGLALVMPDYEQIRRALAADSTTGISERAAELRKSLESLQADLTADRAGVPADELPEVEALLPQLLEAARTLEKAEGLKASRDAFYALSKPLVRWRQAAGQGPEVVYCSMAKRSWLQPEGEEVGNPYHGEAMGGCGEVVSR